MDTAAARCVVCYEVGRAKSMCSPKALLADTWAHAVTKPRDVHVRMFTRPCMHTCACFKQMCLGGCSIAHSPPQGLGARHWLLALVGGMVWRVGLLRDTWGASDSTPTFWKGKFVMGH